jgi:predicted DNA-binding transcriptional regulator YafY
MPTNKHAALRYRALNYCFANRGKKKWPLDALVEEVNRYMQEEFGMNVTVSKRTIQADINLMRSSRPLGFEAPIICKNGHYSYSDPGFSIDQLPINNEELDSLRELIGMIRQLPGIPYLPVIEAMLHRLGAGDPDNETHLQFEVNAQAIGLEWIPVLYKAIHNKKVLNITYAPFLSEPVSIVIHPYLLKEWRKRWYLFGQKAEGQMFSASGTPYSELEVFGFIQRRDGIWNLSLDRIKAVEEAKGISYLNNDYFDPTTWFQDITGVTKPEDQQPVYIMLEAELIAAQYMISKPLHHSQTLVLQDDKRAIFQLFLIPNYELMNDILAYGKYVRVLGPDFFKKMIEDFRGN